MNKICQSCGMPITSIEQLGTNKNGSINKDYCKYCYKNGEFIDKVTMEEYIEMCSKYGSQAGMTNEEMITKDKKNLQWFNILLNRYYQFKQSR